MTTYDFAAEADWEAMAAGMNNIVPFIPVVGTRCLEMGVGRAVCVLPDQEHVHNHIGALHAGAMFAAGETCAGMAFTGAFVDQLDRLMPLAAGAQIRYLAVARGDLTLTGSLRDDVMDIRSRLERDGKVVFVVDVEMRDPKGTLCVEMSVDWHVRRTT